MKYILTFFILAFTLSSIGQTLEFKNMCSSVVVKWEVWVDGGKVFTYTHGDEIEVVTGVWYYVKPKFYDSCGDEIDREYYSEYKGKEIQIKTDIEFDPYSPTRFWEDGILHWMTSGKSLGLFNTICFEDFKP